MVVVTGANGFIGSMMVKQLNQQNIPVLGVVDLVSVEERVQPLLGKKFEQFFTADDFLKFLQQDPQSKKITWIIHMGANSSTTETDASLLKRINTDYTIELFNWCAKNKASLIYASSAATYGAGELGYSDKTDHEVLKPLNLYGESKVAFDRWAVKQNQVPPNWYGLKFFNVYGPNEYHKGAMASVVSKAYKQIQETGKLQLFKSYRPEYKDGDFKRDFIYVKDVCFWMSELMQKTPKSGIYNMGTGSARSWNDLANATFKAMGKTLNIEYIEMPVNIRDQYQYFTEADMDQWYGLGMSRPNFSLESGVDDYVRNYLSQKDPWT